ncbi:MAG: S-layer homology domain-containing protein [Clostridia bacterium]|nr:S-layer homology domain-containing protein [Clostridia bacterium]
MKKILSLIIISFVLSSVSVSAAPVYSDNVASMLAELKIMQGDPDGNMRYDDLVSRAECTKIAVASSVFRNSVATGSKTSPFSDVTYKHWAAPFVTVGVQNGLCKGYLDATFRPNNTVLYEEAATMFLRVLGYTDEDFGASWPDSQVGIAKNLGILDNVPKSIGDELTRRDIATIAYNTLNTKQKNSQAILLSDFNRTIIDDVVLISTTAEDANVPEGKIYTSAGTYNFADTLNTSLIGRRGSVILRGGDTVVSFIPQGIVSSGTDVRMVYSALGNGIVTYKNGAFSQVDVNNSTVFYMDSAKVSASSALSSLEMGDTLRISYKSNGDIDYILCTKGSTQGPLTVKSPTWYTSFGTDSTSLTVMRDGVKSSVSDVRTNDIAYYLKELDIALVYSKKVTGIYEDAKPNKDAPTSVTVSGVTYNIEGVDAFTKLSSSGSFNLGDTVTLLLGKSGEIADVATNSQLSDKVYGFLTEAGAKQTTVSGSTVTKPYVKVILPSGEACEYISNKDYSSMLNRAVFVTLNNGTATVSANVTNNNISGRFTWTSSVHKLGSDTVAPDVKIIEVSTTNSYEKSSVASVFPQRLNGTTLSSSTILYASKNSDGEIDSLILEDITGDMHTYGILTSAKSSSSSMSVSGSYEYISNGNISSVSTQNKAFSVSSGQAVKIVSADGRSVTSLSPLPKAATGKISSITGSEITVGGKTYTMADNVQIYQKKSYEYTMLTIDELNEMKSDHSANLYQDKAITSGGRVRIIVIS